MKKVFKVLMLSLLLALVAPNLIRAQLFDEGDMIFSAGIGLGSTLYSFGSVYNTSVPPIWISGDYCLREDLGPGNLGIGGMLGYSAFKSTYSYIGDDYGWKYTSIFFAARGTYHFTDLVDKLDLYGGVHLGFNIVTTKTYGDGPDDFSPLNNRDIVEPIAGSRYFFADNLAAMGELGYGIAIIKLGISLKL